MAVTKSRAAERPAVRRAGGRRAPWRVVELRWLLGAALLALIGLFLVYRAKEASLAEADAGLTAKKLVNLNALGAREELLPPLSIISNQREREETARKIYNASGAMSNVGRIRGFLTGEQFR